MHLLFLGKDGSLHSWEALLKKGSQLLRKRQATVSAAAGFVRVKWKNQPAAPQNGNGYLPDASPSGEGSKQLFHMSTGSTEWRFFLLNGQSPCRILSAEAKHLPRSSGMKFSRDGHGDCLWLTWPPLFF